MFVSLNRAGNYLGTLLEIRAQYEDRAEEGSAADPSQEASSPTAEGPEPGVLLAAEQIKPLLALLPELTVNTSKTAVSLYAGKLVVGYVLPRRRGLPRLRAFVGDNCPEWATPDTTYEPWCCIDDWGTNMERVAALLREAPRRRAEDMAAGRDAYRRRAQPAANGGTQAAELAPPAP